MLRYAGRRLLAAVPLLLVVPLLVFLLIDLAPGDPAVILAGDDPTPERIEAIRQQMGLDDPVWERYARWVAGVLQGDLGTSLLSDQKVLDMLLRRMNVTVSLVAVAMVVAVIVGVAVAIAAAVRSKGVVDRL